MTRNEFYEKYRDVTFFFKSYYKYTFNYEGEYEGDVVRVGVGGNSSDIYKMNVTTDYPKSIAQLQPYEGMCGEDDFYDY